MDSLVPVEEYLSSQGFEIEHDLENKVIHISLNTEVRNDFGNISIFDHPENKYHLNAWRVDSQLGINPATARFSGWTINDRESEVIRYRLLADRGDFNYDKVMASFL